MIGLDEMGYGRALGEPFYVFRGGIEKSLGQYLRGTLVKASGYWVSSNIRIMLSSEYLDQPAPAPALQIPSSTATVAVRVIDRYSPESKRFAEYRPFARRTANSHSTVERSFPSTLIFSGALRSKVSKPVKRPSSASLFPTIANTSFSTWASVTIGRTTLLAWSDSSKLPLPFKPRRTFPNTSTRTPPTSTSGAPTSQPSSGLITTLWNGDLNVGSYGGWNSCLLSMKILWLHARRAGLAY